MIRQYFSNTNRSANIVHFTKIIGTKQDLKEAQIWPKRTQAVRSRNGWSVFIWAPIKLGNPSHLHHQTATLSFGWALSLLRSTVTCVPLARSSLSGLGSGVCLGQSRCAAGQGGDGHDQWLRRGRHAPHGQVRVCYLRLDLLPLVLSPPSSHLKFCLISL